MITPKKVNQDMTGAKLLVKIFFLCSFSVLLCLSCKDKDPDQQPESPTITNLEVSDITETTAKCIFTINLVEEIQEASVVYNTNSSLPEGSPEISTTNVTNGNISLAITGLNSNTYYYYKVYITTLKGEKIYSTLYMFRTSPPPLDVSTVLIEIEYQENTVQFDVISKLEWAIVSNQPWCTVQPENGEGNSEITVSVSENTSGASRSATLTVTADNLSRQVIIEQSFPPISDIEPEMVFVQGGTFTMGCTMGQGNDCYDDEMPDHQVTVSDFFICTQEITQALWRIIMGNYPSYFKGDSLPVENISWNEIQVFISRLNTLTGKQYRLPTEAEWEFAARGGNNGNNYKFSGSNTADEVAWYWNSIPSQTMGNEGYGTQPAGLKAPNELGLYDMSGNVFEWCSDWYDLYDSSAQTDPTGPSSGTYRVVRGGSWNSSERGVSVSYRGFIVPEQRYNYLGFRLVLSTQ